jgi:hypothetical protein
MLNIGFGARGRLLMRTNNVSLEGSVLNSVRKSSVEGKFHLR